MKKLILILASLFYTLSFAGSPIYWGPGNQATLMPPQFNFQSNSSLLTGSVDPTSVATTANPGSLYLNSTSGKVYSKNDSGSSTNWSLAGGASVVSSIGSFNTASTSGGLDISGSGVLTLHAADGTNGGAVSVGAQTFAGLKTFSTNIISPIVTGSSSASGTLQLQSTTNGTAGKILFGTSAYDEVNNRLGIGTTSPSNDIEIDSNNSSEILVNSAVSGSTNNASVSLERSRGTISSPTAVQSADRLGLYTFNAYSGSAYRTNAVISSFADENHSVSGGGVSLRFETIGNGTTSRTEKMRVTGDGNVAIGTTTATHNLEVVGTVNSTGNISNTGASVVTSIVQTGDGTVALPSYAFASNTATGLYKSGTNQIGVATNGSQVGNIDASGIWTIGNTSGNMVSGTHNIYGIMTMQGSTTANLAFSGGANATSTSTHFPFIYTGNYTTSSGGARAYYVMNGNSQLVGMGTDASNNMIFGTVTATTGVIGTTFATYGTGGAVGFPNLAATSAAQTGTVCWTTVTGNLTVDTTVACLASTIKVKEAVEPLDVGLSEVMALRPISYHLKKEYNPMNLGRMVGFIAEEADKIDPRLVSRDSKGEINGFRYMQYTSVLTKAVQEQQAQIEELKLAIKDLQNKK